MVLLLDLHVLLLKHKLLLLLLLFHHLLKVVGLGFASLLLGLQHSYHRPRLHRFDSSVDAANIPLLSGITASLPLAVTGLALETKAREHL